MDGDQVPRNAKPHSSGDVVTTHHPAAEDIVNSCGGLRIKQHSNPCSSSCLTNPIGIIAPRDGSGINLFVQDLRQYLDTSVPLVDQFFFAAAGHPHGMRKRMAPNYMTFSSQ